MNEKSADGVVGIDLYVESLENYTADDVLKLQQTFDEIYREYAKLLQKNKTAREGTTLNMMIDMLNSVITAKQAHEEALSLFVTKKSEWFLDVENEERIPFDLEEPKINDKYTELFPKLTSTELEQKKMTMGKIVKDFPLLSAENLEDISKGLGKLYQALKEKTEQKQREHDAKLKQASEDFMKVFDESDDENEPTPVKSTQNNFEDKTNTDVTSRASIERWREEDSQAVPDTEPPVAKLHNDNEKKATGWREWIFNLFLSIMHWFRGQEKSTQTHQEKTISHEVQQETRNGVTSGSESKNGLTSREMHGLSRLFSGNKKDNGAQNTLHGHDVAAPHIGRNSYLHVIKKKEKKHQGTSASSASEDSEGNSYHS